LGQLHYGLSAPLSLDVLGEQGDTDRVLYLEMAFEGQVITPRIRLGVTPFSSMAARLLGDVATSPGRLIFEEADTPVVLRHEDGGKLVISNIGSSGEDGVVFAPTSDITGLKILNIGSSGQDGVSIDVDATTSELRVSNLGSSGQDGVSIDVDATGSDLIVSNIGSSGQDGVRLSTTSSSGQLVVSNIGSSGQDGVRLSTDASSSHLVISNIGSSGEDGVRCEVNDNDSRLRVTPPTAGTYEFELVVSDNSALAGLKQGGGDRGITFEIPNDSPRIFIFDAIDSKESTLEPGIYDQSIPGISYSRLEVDSTKGGSLGLGLIGDDELDLSGPGGMVIVGGGDSARVVKGELQLIRNNGGVRDELALLPSDILLHTSSASGSNAVQLVGGAGGGRIALIAEPLTVPIEIVSLSLVSAEPIMVVRSENSSPSDLPAMDLDFDLSDVLRMTMRSPAGQPSDSSKGFSGGLSVYDFPMEYFYDHDGVLIRDAQSSQIMYRANSAGELRVQSTCELALEPTSNVGVGVTGPPEKLFVVGNICATGSIGPCSDARYKKNVKTIGNALEIIEKLEGVNFDWKYEEFPQYEFEKDRQVGLIAQDVEKVLPEIVSEGSDGYYSVDYSRVAPVLIEAVKEQQKKIESLEAQVAKTNKLEKEIAELKEMVMTLAKSKTDSKSEKLALNQ